MSTIRNLMTLSVVVAFAVIMSGCGSGAAETAGTTGTAEVQTTPAAVAPESEATEAATSEAQAPEAGATAAARDEQVAVTDEHQHDDAATDDHHDDAVSHDDHTSGEYSFGEPADRADADRTVRVRATDEMTFRPASVHVHAGEVITFRIKNVGKIPHDFTIGDVDAQAQHEREMAEMAEAGAEMAHDDPNAVVIPPGKARSITWRFEDAGEVLYGCHQPGHYDAGMVGTVDISPSHG